MAAHAEGESAAGLAAVAGPRHVSPDPLPLNLCGDRDNLCENVWAWPEIFGKWESSVDSLIAMLRVLLLPGTTSVQQDGAGLGGV